MDTTTVMGDLGWKYAPSTGGWDELVVILNATTLQTYAVCTMGPDQDNWLQTHWIAREQARRVFVELKFEMRACSSVTGVSACRETFSLFYQETLPDSPSSAKFTRVATIASDATFDESDRANHVLKINTEVRELPPLSQKGFYLAFRDVGARMTLLSVRVYYKRCPATVRGLAAFPDTVASAVPAALIEVRGRCVRNAVAAAGDPTMHCGADGDCVCRPGFEAVGSACREAQPCWPTKTPRKAILSCAEQICVLTCQRKASYTSESGNDFIFSCGMETAACKEARDPAALKVTALFDFPAAKCRLTRHNPSKLTIGSTWLPAIESCLVYSVNIKCNSTEGDINGMGHNTTHNPGSRLTTEFEIAVRAEATTASCDVQCVKLKNDEKLRKTALFLKESVRKEQFIVHFLGAGYKVMRTASMKSGHRGPRGAGQVPSDRESG